MNTMSSWTVVIAASAVLTLTLVVCGGGEEPTKPVEKTEKKTEPAKAESEKKAKAEEKAPTEKSLYERLGGEEAITAVVDDLIDRLSVNEVLNANPDIDKARKAYPPVKLKKLLTEFMCMVTGGPQKYTGRTMKETHAKMNITEKEWNAMAADFKITLDKFKVPEKEQQEMFKLVGTTKADIVTK